MLTSSDLITLGYSPDLTQAGIAYLCRTLPFMGDKLAQITYPDMRIIVAQAATELAFRRLLVDQNVPYQSWQTTPFAHPERHEVILGGRRCRLLNTLITKKNLIRKLRQEPEYLLQTFVPTAFQEAQRDGWDEQDILIFCITSALVTGQRSDLERALSAEQPLCLMRIPPKVWYKTAPMTSQLYSRSLAMKYEACAQIIVELGGLARNGLYQEEQICLPPGQRVEVRKDFATLAFLRVDQIPDGRIGVHNPNLRQTHIIQPYEWVNLWLYGIEITYLGYLNREEFKRKSRRFLTDKKLLAFPGTGSNPIFTPVMALRPLTDLFSRIRQWSAKMTG